MQMILFKMNQQHYLIAAGTVEEVVDTVQITKVPLAPLWVKGLINLRGTVLTVISLAQLVGLPESKTNRNIMIMKKDDERRGLLIDEVIEVVDVDPDDIQLSEDQAALYFTGVVDLGEQTIADVIDVNDKIF
ncbi:chemotaxis protein CheW [Ligilactobacillus acidipiscis DSM 15836]|uniref:Positive regulator of CheA protein activity (CheW) n=3 Tax=Ligilactobacillus acidipiscis TaxID=89059 RepID=A0A0A7RK85_9LACO|nr:chemotaxis protein CheW [Ligilactobacillus acidipiscis]AJA33618.1 purine-binding chemotaxis protein CheW [Ligilactobacillus acidipiscis]KRM30169.1 chemotaxis protein CheW [Ligilactobacillus acidipiscis DSM 15836]SFV41290.1 Positive regulator of CheA protein activity (CheW) [Ligilactobacillus acidipiscis]GAW64811.1 response regulator receiver modulated CheW protein [Ligilactobacillus acidipiscis]GEN19845.1 chemotaxis protein CheW [Ligilactobacillus acidipiscis]